jgi:hypothetical protein
MMNKVKEVKVVHMSLQDMVSSNNIAKGGSGNKFWIVDMDKLAEFDCTILTTQNGKVKLVPIVTGVTNADGTDREPLYLSLGSHYDDIQTMEGNINEVIKVRCAVRSVNPSITDEDLAAVAKANGPKAIQGYVQAKANNEQTIVLIAYDEL